MILSLTQCSCLNMNILGYFFQTIHRKLRYNGIESYTSENLFHKYLRTLS